MINSRIFLDQLKQQPGIDFTHFNTVLSIIETVKRDGDAALKTYSRTFDHVDIDDLIVPAETIKAAYDTLDKTLISSLETAKHNIERFQRSIKYSNQQTGELGQYYHPLSSVGIYVPGGKASYPSTVLMTAVLAQTAGVQNIYVVTPPQTDHINKATLAACYIAGVTQVFQVGGAQAIAALAYGTETIPKVDKIVGPGNQFVALAKKIVFGDVGIDSIAGPSELALVVDETAHPDYVALDVLAQAEHDEAARTFVISESKSVLSKIEQAIIEQTKKQPRKAIIQASLDRHHYLIHTENRQDSIDVINAIAPEHVSIQTVDSESYIDDITKAGALFIGPYAPEAMGDYVLGPSHVLPTSGTARFQNGLTVNDFMTSNSVLHISRETFMNNVDAAIQIAHEEQLFSHRDSLLIRKEDMNDSNQ